MKTPRRQKPNGANPILTSEDGSQFKLTSDQVWFIRQALGLSQRKLAIRLATSQPSILRLETPDADNPAAVHDGPLIILLCGIAKQEGVDLPEASQFDREDAVISSAIKAHKDKSAA